MGTRCLLLSLVLLRPGLVCAGTVACDAWPPDPLPVIHGIFAAEPDLCCDANGDGLVSAADLVSASLAARPSPTATGTETATASPTSSPSPTSTPTPAICPDGGAGLEIGIDNQTGAESVTVALSGQRVGEHCAAGALAGTYEMTLACGAGAAETCARLRGLAPGFWLHSVRVIEPARGQVQHRTSLLTAGFVPNRLDFTAFASVLTVTSTANSGNGSLRRALLDAGAAAKPALIQFDATVFPPGEPTAIQLQFALPNLTASRVTIDGTDPSGAIGNRIVDAGGLGIGALSINGAQNHVVGLRLRNAGGNNRDVLNISGAAADGNLVERTIVENAASADGIGIDQGAGKDFDETANVIRACEIRGAADKGVKVTTGAYARVEDSWVHDNANGGIQATIGGHVQVLRSLVEDNRGGSAQNGLAANANDGGGEPSGFSELVTRGNVVWRSGANGASVRGSSVATLRDDYLARNSSSGLRVLNDIGPPASALVEGVSAVCNAADGAVVANSSLADFGGGQLGSRGSNAFTQNNLRGGGANLRNSADRTIFAADCQWEHCGGGQECSVDDIAAYDLADHGASTSILPARAHRAEEPVITGVWPAKGRAGEWLRIFGSGFNVIDGHFAEDRCSDVTGRNRCVPLRGNCVRIAGVPASVEAITPTMLVVRWPFTCLEPVPLTVTIDRGPTGATSNTFTVCTNEAP